jgi:hypothetical protein
MKSFTKHFLIVLIIASTFSSCEKADTTSVEGAKGTWKLVGGTDTIIFESETFGPSIKYFDLDRGTESIGGNTRPKPASGQYQYAFSPDSIDLVLPFTASPLEFKKFYFKLTSDKFVIGNFYQKVNGLDSILTFERIK